MKKFLALQTVLRRTNAFTIIELLVVIGIISILAVALLVSLNPAEAQKRARDSQRLKDMNTIQAMLEQYINDGGAMSGCATGSPCSSSTVTGTSPNPCGTGNWMALNFCTWAKTVPTDPANGSQRTCILGDGTLSATTCLMRYRAVFSGSNYEIGTLFESTTNAGKLVNDGGTTTAGNACRNLFQIMSSTELTTCGTFTLAGASSAAL